MKPAFKKLLLVALKPEWSFLKQDYQFQKTTDAFNLYQIKESSHALLQTGPGLANSERVFSEFLNRYDVQSVLHFGASGALTEQFSIAEVFVTDKISTQTDQLQIENDLKRAFLEKNPAVSKSNLFSSETVLKNREQKTEIAKKFSVQIVDMESYSFAKLCIQNKIDYLSVRGIFDTLADNLEDLGEPYTQEGDLKPMMIAKNILKNPKLIFTLPHLQKRMNLMNQNFKKIIKWYLGTALLFCLAFSNSSCSSFSCVSKKEPQTLEKGPLKTDAQINTVSLIPDGIHTTLYLKKDIFAENPKLKPFQKFVQSFVPDLDFEKLRKLKVQDLVLGMLDNKDQLGFFAIGKTDPDFPRTPTEVAAFAKENGLAYESYVKNDLTYYRFKDDPTHVLANLSSQFFALGDEAVINQIWQKHAQATEGSNSVSLEPDVLLQLKVTPAQGFKNLLITLKQSVLDPMVVFEMDFSSPLEKIANEAGIILMQKNNTKFQAFWKNGQDESNMTRIKKSWVLSEVPFDQLGLLVSDLYERILSDLFPDQE